MRGVVERHQLHHGGVKLVRVPDGRRAALQVAHVGALLRDDQGALELAGVRRVDPEVGGELHRAADALGDVAERAVAEDGGVQRGEEVVGVRDHRAQVLLDQLRVVLDRLGERAEDDPQFGQLLLEGGGHRDAVEHGVHRHAAQPLLLLQGDAQLLEGPPDFRIHLVQALQRLLRLGRRVVDDVLVVDGRVADVGPRGLRIRLLQRRPSAGRP